MGTRLFVGNLSYNVTEPELKEAFATEGIEVRSVRIALDRDTGRPRGFAFVETATETGAKESIEKLSGRLLQGRPIVLEEAQARAGGPGGAPRPGGGMGGPRPPMGPGGPPRFSGPPRPQGFGPPGAGGGFRPPGGPMAPRPFGPPKPPPPGGEVRPDRAFKTDAPRRERPEKKKSSRPKPEERERGNWHWSGIIDDD